MKLLWGGILLTIASMLCAQASPPKYAEGQIWEYKTRPQDPGSLLKIQKIENYGKGKVYHLSIILVHFSAPGIAGILPHTPVSDVTLDASVTKLSNKTPDFPTTALDKGIAEWQKAKGGVFTIPISEIIDIVDAQISQATEKSKS